MCCCCIICPLGLKFDQTECLLILFVDLIFVHELKVTQGDKSQTLGPPTLLRSVCNLFPDNTILGTSTSLYVGPKKVTAHVETQCPL